MFVFGQYKVMLNTSALQNLEFYQVNQRIFLLKMFIIVTCKAISVLFQIFQENIFETQLLAPFWFACQQKGEKETLKMK